MTDTISRGGCAFYIPEACSSVEQDRFPPTVGTSNMGMRLGRRLKRSAYQVICSNAWSYHRDNCERRLRISRRADQNSAYSLGFRLGRKPK